MPTCNKCGKEFKRLSIAKSPRKTARCYDCRKITSPRKSTDYPSRYYQANKGRIQAQNRTFSGAIQLAYFSRVAVARRHAKPLEFTKEELFNFLTKSNTWISLYNTWVNSNYKLHLRPSLSWVDPSKDFTIDNLKISMRREACSVKKQPLVKHYGITLSNGVYYHCQIRRGGILHHLGSTKDLEEAIKIVDDFLRKIGEK